MGLFLADSGTGRTPICTCNTIQTQRSSYGCGQERKEWILSISWFLSSLIYAATRNAVALLSHCTQNSTSPCKEGFLEKPASLQPLSSLWWFSIYFSKQTLSASYAMTSFQNPPFSLSVHICESIYSSGDINSFYNWNFPPDSILLGKPAFLKRERAKLK